MEIWLIYTLISAILTSAATLAQKKTLMKEHATEFSTILAILTLLISLPFILIIDYSKLQLTPIIIIFFTSIFGAIGFLLIMKSIRHMKITESLPLLALEPGITAILAFIFLKEALSLSQVIGIASLVIGIYILETRAARNILSPFKAIKKSKYIYYVIIALFIYSITSVFDRLVLFKYDMQPEAYIVFVHIFLAMHFIVISSAFYNGIKDVKHGLKKTGWWIFLIALLTLGYRLSQAEAIKIAPVALVLSIKRISILFTVIIGGELFHEKNLFKKIIATSIIIAGALLIII